MYLYFIFLDSCLRTGEVTESVLLVSGEISILQIILDIDSLFESGQVLDVPKVLGRGICISHIVHDTKR